MTEIDRRTEIERKLEEEQANRVATEGNPAPSADNANLAATPQPGVYQTPAYTMAPPSVETPWSSLTIQSSIPENPQPSATPMREPGQMFTEQQTWPPEPSAPTQAWNAPPMLPKKKSALERMKDKGGILGGLAAGLLFLFKTLAPIFAILGKLKFLLIFKTIFITFGSMFLSIWAYSISYGWAFGAGVVFLIFFHECGHATAGLIKGHKPGMMVFIPFMGAFVTIRGGKDLEEDAFIGIMGPVFGAVAGVICVVLALATHNPFFFVLAYFNFLINLFNLAPTVPLDGGWIVPLFSPKLLAFGAILMVILGFRNPLIWVLGLLSIPRIIGGWKADPTTQPYYQVRAAAKWIYGLAYIGLAGFLAIGMMLCHEVIIGKIMP